MNDEEVIKRRRGQGKYTAREGGDFNLYDEAQADDDFGSSQVAASSNVSRAGRLAGAQAMAGSGGNTKKQVGAGLMMTGNPYAMAAGAGLAVLGSVEEKRKQQEMANYQAKLNRNQSQQDAIGNLIRVSQGMRNL